VFPGKGKRKKTESKAALFSVKKPEQATTAVGRGGRRLGERSFQAALERIETVKNLIRVISPAERRRKYLLLGGRFRKEIGASKKGRALGLRTRTKSGDAKKRNFKKIHRKRKKGRYLTHAYRIGTSR